MKIKRNGYNVECILKMKSFVVKNEFFCSIKSYGLYCYICIIYRNSGMKVIITKGTFMLEP